MFIVPCGRLIYTNLTSQPGSCPPLKQWSCACLVASTLPETSDKSGPVRGRGMGKNIARLKKQKEREEQLGWASLDPLGKHHPNCSHFGPGLTVL